MGTPSAREDVGYLRRHIRNRQTANSFLDIINRKTSQAQVNMSTIVADIRMYLRMSEFRDCKQEEGVDSAILREILKKIITKKC